MLREVISSPKVPDIIHLDLGIGEVAITDTVVGSHQAAEDPGWHPGHQLGALISQQQSPAMQGKCHVCPDTDRVHN